MNALRLFALSSWNFCRFESWCLCIANRNSGFTRKNRGRSVNMVGQHLPSSDEEEAQRRGGAIKRLIFLNKPPRPGHLLSQGGRCCPTNLFTPCKTAQVFLCKALPSFGGWREAPGWCWSETTPARHRFFPISRIASLTSLSLVRTSSQRRFVLSAASVFSPGHRMRTFEGWNDTLQSTEFAESIQRLFITYRCVFHAACVVQGRVLRAD